MDKRRPPRVVIRKYNLRMPDVLYQRLRQVSGYYGISQARIAREGLAREINRIIKECPPAMLKGIAEVER
jgi:hypothetical protein